MISILWYQLTLKPKPLPPDIRLDGLTAIVRGSNTGIGFEAAKELAAHGLSRLILAARSVPKGEEARADISRESPECNVEVWQLDQESWGKYGCVRAEGAGPGAAGHSPS